MSERRPVQETAPPETVPDRHAERLTEEYGRIRGALKRRSGRLEGYRQLLNQARIPVPVDVYLTRTIKLAGYGAAGGGTLGAVLGLAGSLVSGWAVAVVLTLPLLGASVAGGVVGAGRLVWPKFVARQRRIEIERTLPYDIAYLYALTQGGVDSFDALRALAEAREDYGALGTELQTAVNDVDHFGSDPIGALTRLQKRTASESLSLFLEGMIGTIDAGGSVDQYLLTETEQAYRQVERDQDRFLESLSVYAELYIGLLVVAPIFGVIVLLVVTVLGAAASMVPLAVLIYVVVPALTGAFLWLISQSTGGSGRTKRQTETAGVDPPAELDPERLAAYHENRSRQRWEQLTTAPVDWIRERPVQTLAVTGPAVLVFLGLGIASGALSAAAAVEVPVVTTIVFGVAPLLVLLVPVAIVHEIQRRRDRRMSGQFPDVLEQLANANKQGLTIAEAVAVAARSATGPLGRQLEMTARDLTWGAGPTEALAGLRERLQTRSLRRTLTLITDASTYSSSLHRVIDIAARDAKNSRELKKNRRSETQAYTIIVVISFGLYLFMLVVLDQSFLAQIEELPEIEGTDAILGISFAVELDRGVYQLLLFHAAIVQGVGAGLVAGELGEESWKSGVKYSLLFVTAAAAAFFVFVGW